MRVPIEGEFIELGQLLKKLRFVSSGGQVKPFLKKNRVTVNGKSEQRRGRKLCPGDIVRIEGFAEVLEIVGKD